MLIYIIWPDWKMSTFIEGRIGNVEMSPYSSLRCGDTNQSSSTPHPEVDNFVTPVFFSFSPSQVSGISSPLLEHSIILHFHSNIATQRPKDPCSIVTLKAQNAQKIFNIKHEYL